MCVRVVSFLFQPSLVLPRLAKVLDNDTHQLRLQVPPQSVSTSNSLSRDNDSVIPGRQHQSSHNVSTSPARSEQPSQKFYTIPNSMPECIFSETQPLPGRVDVQVRASLNSSITL